MRVLLLAISALATLASVSGDSGADLRPVQTFYIPLPEQALYDNVFKKINGRRVSGKVNTQISFAAAADNTVIWVDHNEDGYDADLLNAFNNRQPKTEVWGDGDASNGCAPSVKSCSDANDKPLAKGQVEVIDNRMGEPGPIYNGGDLIKASKPIAITRSAYPDNPGSLMAGAVEVREEKNWGTSYTAPIGIDMKDKGYLGAYDLVKIAVMASKDDTVVTKPDGSTVTLDQGESKMIDVKQGDTITSSKPVQASLMAGDIDSTYELRWYSLTPRDKWSDVYYAPVGDSAGKTKVTVFNPNGSPITVKIDTKDGSKMITVGAGESKQSEVIPTYQSAKVSSVNGESFFALSETDNTGSGQLYDWGYPLMTENLLTPEVIVGLGYGCESNDCDKDWGRKNTKFTIPTHARSQVWVAPVEDAYVHIRYNFGNSDADVVTMQIKALESKNFTDPADKDMSGAIIWATKESDPKSEPVKVSAAWGQNAGLSGTSDQKALDLGTVVLPFEPLRAICDVELGDGDNDGSGTISKGDTVKFVVTVLNNGVLPIEANTLQVETLEGIHALEKVEVGDKKVYQYEYTVKEGDVFYNDICKVDINTIPPPTKPPTLAPTTADTTEAPTAAPVTTGAPTAAPVTTGAPTAAPVTTEAPTEPPVTTEAPTGPPVPDTTIPPPDTTEAPPTGTSGDPHFTMFNGHKFDFHGECDVVQVNNPDYNNGQGMRIHLRLKQVRFWSYVQSVAVQIGDDTLEVRGGFHIPFTEYWVNGKQGPAMKVSHVLPFTIGDHKVRFRVLNDHTFQFKVFLGDKESILLRSVKDWMKIEMQHHTKEIFGNSTGILGHYETGEMWARDGVAVFDEADTNSFGMEWQVREDEPMLFHNVQGPQYPEQCTMPSSVSARRRLGESKITRNAAAKACAHASASDKSDCIFDVLAADDIDMAAMY